MVNALFTMASYRGGMGPAGVSTKLLARVLAVALALVMLLGWSSAAQAQDCGAATARGTAPESWQTYCWLNLDSYNDTQARSAGGQNLSFNLPDGSQLSFNVRVTGGTGTAYNAVAAPSWSGAAIGNTAFIGIPGRPGLYTASAGNRTIAISGISIIPPAGAAASVFAFIVADAESSNQSEFLRMTTNGGAWQVLDNVPPISGSTWPTLTGTGTSTATITGVAGTVGAHILASNSPTSVTVETQAGGLQGVMFAVRFASIRLEKRIVGTRVAAADQFRYEIVATPTGVAMAGGTTSGSGAGPFSVPPVVMSAGVPVTLRETMAAGSASTLSQYSSRLTCINTAGPTRPALPNNVATTSLNIGTLEFGEALSCTFTNGAQPRLRLRKALASSRRFTGDQFTVRIRDGETVIAQATTTGSSSTVNGGDTGFVQLVDGTAYSLDEIAAGTANLGNYDAEMSCSNSFSSSTTAMPGTMPGILTPGPGDIITCTITNDRRTTAVLVVQKSSSVISDPVNGTVNPKAIPGAIIEYVITVTNAGNRAVDSSSIVIIDEMPAEMAFVPGVPVTFTNGSPSSGLNSFNPATMVRFSSQPGGAGPFTYTPVGAADPDVRAIRIAPTGTMQRATSGTSQPSFTIRFRAQMQ
jgi:uncharacterized repeat protein (TIGR01451 family)